MTSVDGIDWDLELVPKSELLLKDPQRFIAERVAESRPATAAPAQQ